MATMPLRLVVEMPQRRSENHWFFLLGLFLAYALCRTLI